MHLLIAYLTDKQKLIWGLRSKGFTEAGIVRKLKVHPNYLLIGEVARKTKLSRAAVSAYLKALCAEGKIEVLRKVGATFY